jgi:hypothetical protein
VVTIKLANVLAGQVKDAVVFVVNFFEDFNVDLEVEKQKKRS